MSLRGTPEEHCAAARRHLRFAGPAVAAAEKASRKGRCIEAQTSLVSLIGRERYISRDLYWTHNHCSLDKNEVELLRRFKYAVRDIARGCKAPSVSSAVTRRPGRVTPNSIRASIKRSSFPSFSLPAWLRPRSQQL